MANDLGFVFDWDGVVVDSSRQHEESWNVLAAEENLPLFEGHFKIGFGKKNEYIIPNVLKWSEDPAEVRRLADLKESIYRRLVRESGLSPMAGVKGFIEVLEANKLRRVVGSSTPRANIDAVMEIIGLNGAFEAIVAAEDVTDGKPNPEVFLKAAQCIETDPRRCVVFEDSFGGIEAGKAAGMTVVGIASTHPIEKIRDAGVDLAVASFNDLELSQLQRLVSN